MLSLSLSLAPTTSATSPVGSTFRWSPPHDAQRAIRVPSARDIISSGGSRISTGQEQVIAACVIDQTSFGHGADGAAVHEQELQKPSGGFTHEFGSGFGAGPIPG